MADAGNVARYHFVFYCLVTRCLQVEREAQDLEVEIRKKPKDLVTPVQVTVRRVVVRIRLPTPVLTRAAVEVQFAIKRRENHPKTNMPVKSAAR